MTFLCLECSKYVSELKIRFDEQEQAKKRFEKKNGVYPNQSVLGYCEPCFNLMNFKHKQFALKKYGGIGMEKDEEREMGAVERKGRLLFKELNLLERLIAQTEKLPEK